MTPMDELRKGFDELGIKYTTDDSDDYEVIEWRGSYNLWWQFVYDPYDGEPYGELRLLETGSTHLTPKQAIAATVGTGTCRCTVETSNDYYDDYTRYHMECGFTMYSDEIDKPRFCGGCGRRVVTG